MNCLYCGKKIKASASEDEKNNCWHQRCVKSFFGTDTMPTLNVTAEELNKLADTAVNQGLTVPGVQKKLSLNLSTDTDVRLTIVDYPTGYILKPQTKEFDSLPEFEDLAMRLAEIAGIQTVPHAMIKLHNEYAYITKRIDRLIKDNTVDLYAMEDFCQLSNRLTQDKYKGSYEKCGRIIAEYSIHPGLDMSELFLRIVFSFIIGNSDMHLKNFSLKETEPANREFCLSQAYDILPVNIVMPEDEEQTALTLNGKKRNIRKNDFKIFADHCNLPERSADNMLTTLCSLKNNFLSQCENSHLSKDNKEKMALLIEERIAIIS